MYDFKHQIKNQEPYTTHPPHANTITKKETNYFQIRNILFIIALIMIVLIGSAFTFRNYQSYEKKQLSNAITQSVINNLYVNNKVIKLNDQELKTIIQSIARKIEKNPNQIQYTTK